MKTLFLPVIMLLAAFGTGCGDDDTGGASGGGAGPDPTGTAASLPRSEYDAAVAELDACFESFDLTVQSFWHPNDPPFVQLEPAAAQGAWEVCRPLHLELLSAALQVPREGVDRGLAFYDCMASHGFLAFGVYGQVEDVDAYLAGYDDCRSDPADDGETAYCRLATAARDRGQRVPGFSITGVPVAGSVEDAQALLDEALAVASDDIRPDLETYRDAFGGGPEPGGAVERIIAYTEQTCGLTDTLLGALD